MGLLPSLSTHSLKFDQPGTTYTGILTDIGPEQQATKYSPMPGQNGGPDFWDDEKTRPKMQRKFTLQTNLREPGDQADDGLRALWATITSKPGSVYHAVNKALEGASSLGGQLTITFTGFDPESKNPQNPRKLYTASYAGPTPGQLLNGGAATTAASSTPPAAATQEAAVATPPPVTIPTGFTEELWNGMTEEARNAVLALQ